MLVDVTTISVVGVGDVVSVVDVDTCVGYREGACMIRCFLYS